MAGTQAKQLLHQEIFLDTNADVAEFCPVAGHLQWLAVGTYELNEASRQRHGRLHLYSLAPSSSSAENGQPCLQLSASLDLPGIFDLQWTQLPSLQHQPCIGLALADGSLQLFAVAAVAAKEDGERQNGAQQPAQHCLKQQVQGASAELQQLCSCQAVSEGMALALDWNQQNAAAPLAAVSSSSGSISVLQVTPTAITQLLEWQGHDLEAWMASWDKHHANVLYSGSDDSTFKGWDVRCPAAVSSSSSNSTSTAGNSSPQAAAETGASPLFANRRAHSAGVCCISSHPRREHVLVTGSYDEAVRLWDVRMLQRPVETCQVSTGGGVWRLKWHPRQDGLLLAACMYNGFALLEVDQAWGQLQAVEEYRGHDSIAYGADWYRGCWPLECGGEATGSSGAEGAPEGRHEQREDAAAVAESLAQLGLSEVVEHQGQKVADKQRDVVATCSFYDRRVHLWSPQHTSC